MELPNSNNGFQKFVDEDELQNEAKHLQQEGKKAKEQAQHMLEETKDVAQKGMAAAINAEKQGEHYAEVGKHIYDEGKEKAIQIEHVAEEQVEKTEQYVITHSKCLRVVAAVICIGTWLPFYWFMHAQLRLWDLFVNVELKLQSRFRKVMFILFMIVFGYGIATTVLTLSAIANMCGRCEHLQNDVSALKGFQHLVYQGDANYVANKIEGVLLYIFSDYELKAPQQLTDDIEKAKLQAQNIKDAAQNAEQTLEKVTIK